MTDQQRRRLEEMLNDVSDAIKDEPGFLSDQELKASFIVVQTATAAIKFNETENLAELCSGFCKEKAEPNP